MKLTPLNCPECGAPVDVPEEALRTECESCGTRFEIEREGDTSPPGPDEAPVEPELDSASEEEEEEEVWPTDIGDLSGPIEITEADTGERLGSISEEHLNFLTTELVVEVARTGKLPVVNFAAGGIATPADAALLMQIGVEGVFVGSGIFKSDNPAKMADAIVRATTHYNDPDMLAEISHGLGDAMPGIEASKIPEDQQLQTRGW